MLASVHLMTMGLPNSTERCHLLFMRRSGRITPVLRGTVETSNLAGGIALAAEAVHSTHFPARAAPAVVVRHVGAPAVACGAELELRLVAVVCRAGIAAFRAARRAFRCSHHHHLLEHASACVVHGADAAGRRTAGCNACLGRVEVSRWACSFHRPLARACVHCTMRCTDG